MVLYLDAIEAEVIEALIVSTAVFVLIGGAAVQHHGHMRPRKDLDILIEASPANAAAVAAALNIIAPGRYPLTPDHLAELAKSVTKFELRGAHQNIEFLGHLDGVTTEDAMRDAELVDAPDAGRVPVLSKAHVIASKRAIGRPEDVADVEALGG